MNSLTFLKAAYVIAWLVYLGYLFRILLRMRRVERELAEVRTDGSPSNPQKTGPELQRQRA